MDFELTASTWMLLFFILLLSVSIWKIQAFLPNKVLSDDDTTFEATQALEKLMLKIITQKKGLLNEEELFLFISKDEDFDAQLFWRFNLNRLKHLLSSYYVKHTNTSDIQSIYLHLDK